MRCPKCGTDSWPAKRFCAECGSALPIQCPKCGADTPAHAKFCADCGAALAAAAPATVGTPPEVSSVGERRHLTVLFCDLVGSTVIASQLDPEEWRELIADYHRAAADAITRFGGHVAKYLGDGVMAYFGWPQAHENDAERATRAGLALVQAVACLSPQSSHAMLSVRVGIDSGAVVVGASAGQDADVFGDVPNIAARVQSAAEPGTVAITAATYRLTSGAFVIEDLGSQQLRGVERPMQLYRVVQPSSIRGRLQAAAAARGLTPFVGREDELRLLLHRWERASDGEGQVVTIVGEPGIGKSRLVHQFREQIAGVPHTWLQCAAAPFFQNTPFYAVTQLLGENLDRDQRLKGFEASLGETTIKLDEAQPLMVPISDLPAGANQTSSSLTPDQQRKRLLAALVEWIFDTAGAQALVIVVEDLHWADPSSVELVQLIADQGPTARLLLICTARPEFRTPWPLRAHHTQINLNRLSIRNVRTMVEEVAARTVLAEETIKALVERTNGVPLFVEELTRTVLESGEIKRTSSIPVTLHDSLMARLDRLGSAKEVAQVAAVLGREFSYRLLQAVSSIPEQELEPALAKLIGAELIYARGIAPEATYQFKHSLVRDAAYEALLRTRRKELHRRAARIINEKFVIAQPEVVARHWTEAGETELAIAEWSRAAVAAEARNAFIEALHSYQEAATLLNQLPETAERDAREFTLRQPIIRMLYMTGGYATPETITATERAAVVAAKSGNLAQLVFSLAMTGFTRMFSGDLRGAAALAAQVLEHARSEASPSSLGCAYNFSMETACFCGDLSGAEDHFRAGSPFFGEPSLRSLPGTANTGVFGVASWNAWILGRADTARERMAQMWAAARPDNPLEQAVSGVFEAMLHVFMRQYEKAETVAIPAIELADKYQLPQVSAGSRCLLGIAQAYLGHASKGATLIKQGLAEISNMNMKLLSGMFMGFLAAAQERDGSNSSALETIDQALGASEDEVFYRPEILRMRGELRQKLNQQSAAEADFRAAIQLANRICAKAWELRATTSLARLIIEQDRRDEAQKILAPIYNSFTEGFDTADLKDAKLLLDELSACQ